MQVSIEQLNSCQTVLTIEVDTEKVAESIEEVYKDYAKHATVPGFRKGKAPRHLLERMIDQESLKRSAIENMVGEAYYEAIKQEDIHPYTDPEIDIVQYEPGKPFIFKANVPLPPKVELGDYKGIEVERRTVEITDEDVDAQVKYLQDSRATTDKVEGRGIGPNDIVIAELSSGPQGEEKSEPKRSLIQMGSNIPGFDENVLGLNPGERKSFDITYPEDYSDAELAGKVFSFDVSVESLRERKVPELDDTFAKSVGEFENMDALRADMKKHIIESAEETADREVEHKIIDEIVARSTVCFPDVMVDHEAHHDAEELGKRLSQQGITIEQYLKRSNKSEEDFIQELRAEASKKLSIGLVLGDIADAENLEVSDADVDAEIDRIVAESNAERESVEEYMESRGGKPFLKNSMYNKKIMDYLKSVSVIK